MEKGTFVIISSISVIIGFILLVSSLSITGNVISDKIGERTGSLLGLVFIVSGIVLFMTRGTESILVNKTRGGLAVFKTDRFLKSSRKYDPKKINRAILKIGTGLGKEERLVTSKDDFSIRDDEGARLIFDYQKGGESILLKDYLPKHKYEKLRRKKY